MYCIFVAGIPASGKSTMAAFLGEQLGLPVLSKDSVKEILFDTLGFRSRAEKVRLGDAAARMLCYAAEQLMRAGQLFCWRTILKTGRGRRFSPFSRGTVIPASRSPLPAITVRFTAALRPGSRTRPGTGAMPSMTATRSLKAQSGRQRPLPSQISVPEFRPAGWTALRQTAPASWSIPPIFPKWTRRRFSAGSAPASRPI